MSKSKIIIVGAGGEGREAAWIAERINSEKSNEIQILGFIDDDQEKHNRFINGYPVLGSLDRLEEFKQQDIRIIVAIGYPQIKKEIVEKIRKIDQNFKFESLIDPNALVAENSIIGQGSIISPGAVISVNAAIGENVLIGTNVCIGHDGFIESCVSVFPSACIAGSTVIKENALIGSSATVLQGLTVGKDAVIGAGAVVIKNVESHTTVAGVPAKRIDFKK